jgi:hypothetical protein
MRLQNSPFGRRLCLLVAQEFAARGYHLDAEGFFDRVPLHELELDELELLARAALAARHQPLAISRFEEWKRRKPDDKTAQAGLDEAKAMITNISIKSKLLELGQLLAQKLLRHDRVRPVSKS